MKRLVAVAGLILCAGLLPAAETKPWSVRFADSEIARHPDPMTLDSEQPKWEYTHGLVLKAILAVGDRTGDPRYEKYVRAYYDGMIGADASIRTYDASEFNIDRINPGKPLFALYRKTKDAKYKAALDRLRQQMREHPRTSEGGFWHKKRYPSQMWLDGLYMASPFLAQYAREFDEPALFDDVVKQFVLMEKHARDDEDGPAVPRLGREPAAEVGGSGDRPVEELLGTRDRLVRDGARGHARLRTREPRRPEGPGRHPGPPGRGHGARAGPEDRRVVAGASTSPGARRTTSRPPSPR